MTGPPAQPSKTSRASREVWLVVGFTVAGGILRLWAPQHLGLVHFDEGIYALAGLWPFSLGGLAALDPTVIAYAPPGFPLLVGVSYLALGISDLSAIFVSVLMGTLTIPLAAWLAWRSFGAGAGAAAAALVAFSGAHAAFSRMALTDASFLFSWTLGMICAQRFLERPRVSTALALGVSTGLAQHLKYNGWLIGAFVILVACVRMATDSNERTRQRLSAVWGYGLLAVLLAGVTYWPWFRFVEAHGGYARLMAHHRGYMGGVGTWVPHLALQLHQMELLSGGAAWLGGGALGAIAGGVAVAGLKGPQRFLRGLLLVLGSAAIAAAPALQWAAVPLVYPIFRIPRGAAEQFLVACWLALTLLTPFYHPYARLWLPVSLMSWLLIAGALVSFLDGTRGAGLGTGRPILRLWLVLWFLCAAWILVASLNQPRGGSRGIPGPLARSDSLRQAVFQARADLPEGLAGLRLLVRPPVTFYLGGKVPARVVASSAGLMDEGPPGAWAIVDQALLRQESDDPSVLERLRTRWEAVRAYPTRLNLPTLLDVEPDAAVAGRAEAVDVTLWLLRPRTAGTPQ